MPENPHVFDRRVLGMRRERRAAGIDDHDFLFQEVGERLAERLDDITRRFPLALDLGCRGGHMGRLVEGRGGIETLIRCDLSPAMAARAGAPAVAADEELLPFAGHQLDLVLSCLALHWVNDLPGALIQIRRALKPDGLLLAAMLGGETLNELRAAWMEAEMAQEGGAGPRVSPFAGLADAGDLLKRAGFAMPVADLDTITVSYEDPLRLMEDLRHMGESNAHAGRRRTFTRRATLMSAAARYREMFGDKDGRVPATFQVLYLTAWAPTP